MIGKPVMIDCWASTLDECSEKHSKEHLISASLFPDVKAINVSGFPWCKGETKTIGLANLTSKILCTKHNNSLSPLDTAAGTAFKVFNDSTTLTNKRLVIEPPKFKTRHFHINGFLLERWFLKTLINLCRESEFFLGFDTKIPGIPTEHHVRICFGKALFHGKSGLYLTSRKGAEIISKPEVEFTPIIDKDENVVVGGFFKFRGFFFFLSLLEELPNNFDWITSSDDGSEWVGTQPSWHFRKMKCSVNGFCSHIIHFDW